MADWSDNALAILRARYLKRNENGDVIESPEEMLERVASAVANAETIKDNKEKYHEKFLEIMDKLEFLPNSPTLMNAGRELGQLSACFVLPIEDSIESIFNAVKQGAVIHKTGGGTGFDFSKLRPVNSFVKSTYGVASGPVSFMQAFNVATEIVRQGGVRRGANLGVLHISHPDIYRWISCKVDPTQFSNFNISVAITDKFINSVRNGGMHYLIDPSRKSMRKEVDAKELFDLICQNAWKNGEPGVIFIDTINRLNLTPWLGRIESTNPCGEMPLLPYESCNLGSIDLAKFVDGKDFHWRKLGSVIRIAIRFLDNVIDVNKYPKARIERKTKLTRKIGLGVMGWADSLIKRGIKYDSSEALNEAEKLMHFISDISHDASRELGREKGVFPASRKVLRRNATTTTIAPTGTLSVLANCSSSIEPLFAREYSKKVLDGVELKFNHAYSNSEAVVTALEISPEYHVRMQASFQKYTDNAVSKTINLPFEASVENVRDAILLAYSLGCKGLTLYRQGTRDAPLQVSTEGYLTECSSGKCSLV